MKAAAPFETKAPLRIIAERLPLDRIDHAFAGLRKGDATRSVITFA